MKKTERAGFGGLDIQRTPMGTRISLFIERPGLVIGRGGEAIDKLTKTLEKEFALDNPQIEVQEVENPSLNANIMAEKLAVALERGWHFRRAGHSTVRRIMDAGARGCQVVISGKLTGQRHRREKFKEGHIKYCGEPRLKFMREGFAVAKLKQGVIGVKVQIMDPAAKLPDDIEIEKALVPEEVEAPAVEAPPVEVSIEEEKVPTEEAKVEEPQVEAKVEVVEVPAESAAEEKAGANAEKEKLKKKKVEVKDLKARKLKKVARKLEKLGEDVDVDVVVEEKEEKG